jgi:hypothetical protein
MSYTVINCHPTRYSRGVGVEGGNGDGSLGEAWVEAGERGQEWVCPIEVVEINKSYFFLQSSNIYQKSLTLYIQKETRAAPHVYCSKSISCLPKTFLLLFNEIQEYEKLYLYLQ